MKAPGAWAFKLYLQGGPWTFPGLGQSSLWVSRLPLKQSLLARAVSDPQMSSLGLPHTAST